MRSQLLTLAALLIPTLLSAQSPQFSSELTKSKKADSTLYNPQTFDTQFDNVKVKYRETRAEQKGDSLIYNASAFKVIEGSSAEDLLAKMPGIVVEGGEIQAQGESVKKVLLDGKEFFEGDVNIAVKNLPSDIIESIEVFDKASEQAAFTGFDDGDQVKTINIVTKASFRIGAFGELYAGYGTNERYKAGGNINLFNEKQRLSILGMSNNINQQNFSQEDLAGVMSSSSGGGGRKGGGGGGSDFMIGSLSGITKSNAIGTNFIDEWGGGKVKFTGSYFYNKSQNDKIQESILEYFESSLLGQSYEDTSNTEMDNLNHRVNAKIDYTINPTNIITLTSKLSMQDNSSSGYSEDRLFDSGTLTSGESTDTQSDNRAYSLSTELVYRHRFSKVGRTLSLMMSGSLSDTNADAYSYYKSLVEGVDPSTEDQFKESIVKKYTLRSNLTFTEQLLTKLQLSATYKLSYTKSDSDKEVYNQGVDSEIFNSLNESLSNTFQSDYLTQSAGLGLRYYNGKLMVSGSLDLQYASLIGDQTYPVADDITKDYISFLPSMFGRYTINSISSMMFRYRSSTSNPSISDLQDVIDNSSPYFVSTGNPELDQQVNHTANVRYVRTARSGTSFIAMVGGTISQDYVSDSTYLLTQAETINGVNLIKGAQFTKPVNLDGYYSVNTMLTYGFPVDFIRSNVNVSVSASMTNTPTIFDGVKSETRELTIVPKIVIGSNISENLDFTLSYSTSLSEALSTAESTDSDDYIMHTAAAKLGWVIWKGITLSNSFTYIGYTGIESFDDPNYYLWSASLGKKFLKQNAAEIKIEASDILQQNQAFSRTVGSNYYKYTTSNVLQPYWMLTFSYKFR